MGEIQGSMWTTGLFIILFLGMTSMLFYAIDIMGYNSGIYSVEDNIKAGNLTYITTLGEKFNVCGAAYDTNTDCSAIIEINEDQHYVIYQLSYDGLILNKDASSDDDHIVLLPY